jgi:serine/threonine protein kinase
VNHLPLLQAMKRDHTVLKSLLRQLLSALCIFSEHHIVHSDIKPDNILVEEDVRQQQFRVRFIDLGSAFTFDCMESLALATPEYMPPEALETCVGRSGFAGLGGGSGTGRLSMASRTGAGGSTGSSGRASAMAAKAADQMAKLQKNSQPWSFDVWSLGSIVLELCTGMPLWLSYKCRVADDQRANSAAMGLFAVPGRDPEKIMQKQSDALRQRGLSSVLRGALGVPLGTENELAEGGGLDLLSKMLAWEPTDRISPQAALDHAWLRERGSSV